MKKSQQNNHSNKPIKCNAKPFYFTNRKATFDNHYHSLQQFATIINEKKHYQTKIKQQIWKLDQLQNVQTQDDSSIDKNNQVCHQPSRIEVQPFQIGDDIKLSTNSKSEANLIFNINPLQKFLEHQAKEQSNTNILIEKSQQEYRQCCRNLTQYLKKKTFKVFKQIVNTVTEKNKKTKAADYLCFYNTTLKYIRYWKIEAGLQNYQEASIKSSFLSIQQKNNLLIKSRRAFGFKGISQRFFQIRKHKYLKQFKYFQQNLKKESFFKYTQATLLRKKQWQSKMGQILLQVVKSRLASMINLKRKIKSLESKQKVLTNIKLHRKFIDFADQCNKIVQFKTFCNKIKFSSTTKPASQQGLRQSQSINLLLNSQKCKYLYIKKSFGHLIEQVSAQLRLKKLKAVISKSRISNTIKCFSYLSQNFIQPLNDKINELNWKIKRNRLQLFGNNFKFIRKTKVLKRQIKKRNKRVILLFGSFLNKQQVKQFFNQIRYAKNTTKRLQFAQLALSRLNKACMIKKVFQFLKKYKREQVDSQVSFDQKSLQSCIQEICRNQQNNQSQQKIKEQEKDNQKIVNQYQFWKEIHQVSLKNQQLSKYLVNRKCKVVICLLRKEKQAMTIKKTLQQKTFIIYQFVNKKSVSYAIGKLMQNVNQSKQIAIKQQHLQKQLQSNYVSNFFKELQQYKFIQEKFREAQKFIKDNKYKTLLKISKQYQQKIKQIKRKQIATVKSKQRRLKLKTLNRFKQIISEKQLLLDKRLSLARFLSEKQSKLFIQNLLKFLIKKSRRQKKVNQNFEEEITSQINEKSNHKLLYSQDKFLAPQQIISENSSQKPSNQDLFSANLYEQKEEKHLIYWDQSNKAAFVNFPKQIQCNNSVEQLYFYNQEPMQCDQDQLQQKQYFQLEISLTRLRKLFFFKNLSYFFKRQNQTMRQSSIFQQANQVKLNHSQHIYEKENQSKAEKQNVDNLQNSQHSGFSSVSQSSTKQYVSFVFESKLKAKAFNILKGFKKMKNQKGLQQSQFFIVKKTLNHLNQSLSIKQKNDLMKKSLDGLQMYCKQKKCLRVYLSEIQGQLVYYPKTQQQKSEFKILTNYLSNESEDQLKQ